MGEGWAIKKTEQDILNKVVRGNILLLIYKAVINIDMKFVKEDHRQRAHQNLECHQDQ